MSEEGAPLTPFETRSAPELAKLFVVQLGNKQLHQVMRCMGGSGPDWVTYPSRVLGMARMVYHTMEDEEPSDMLNHVSETPFFASMRYDEFFGKEFQSCPMVMHCFPRGQNDGLNAKLWWLICSENHFCVRWHKRHGRSSGMRHGWRSSSSGVQAPVRPSVQGPVGEVPATAPFSIPLHHRYRRWMGGVSCPRSFYFCHCPVRRPQNRQQSAQKNKAPSTAHLQQCPPSPVPPADGSRVSSSYSPSAGGFEPASSGQQPAAQPLRHAAKSQGWGPLALVKPMLSYGHEFSRDKQVT